MYLYLLCMYKRGSPVSHQHLFSHAVPFEMGSFLNLLPSAAALAFSRLPAIKPGSHAYTPPTNHLPRPWLSLSFLKQGLTTQLWLAR